MHESINPCISKIAQMIKEFTMIEDVFKRSWKQIRARPRNGGAN